jgi:hypothetical protein
MKKLLPVIFLFISCHAYSQITVTPATLELDTRWLKNEVYTTTDYWIVDTGRIYVQTFKSTIDVKNKLNKIYIISEIIKSALGERRKDTSILDLHDLSPIYHSAFSSKGDYVLYFKKGIMTGYIKDPQKLPTLIRDTIREQYFEPNAYTTMFRCLALKEGFMAIIPIYDFIHRKVVRVYLQNVESLKEGNRKVWKLSVLNEADKDTKNHYYFDQQTRKFLRLEREIGNYKLLTIPE